MKLEVNDIVKIRRGDFGVVVGFNNKPCAILFHSFTSVLTRYNENLKHSNKEYDIVAVYNGDKVESYKEVYRAKFDPDALELELRYKESV